MPRFDTIRQTRREMAELKDLSERLNTFAGRAEETCVNLCRRAVQEALSHSPDGLTRLIGDRAWQLCAELVLSEGYFIIPEIDLNRRLSTGEIWDLTKSARRQLMLFEQPETIQHIEETLRLFLYNLIYERLDHVAAGENGEEATLFVPLYTLHADPADAIQSLLHITFRKPTAEGTFDRLGERLWQNVLLASGIDPAREEESRKQPVLPTQAKDKNPAELVEAYLAGTPFIQFLNTPIPFSIPHRARFEHTHIVGGSGHGKTQLLQSLILRDLNKVRDGQGSLIVIDSQGGLIKNLLELEAVGLMAERVVLIYPQDIKYPPALNLFDFGLERVGRYNEVEQEKLINGAIALYEYVFGALLGAELTQRQGVIFRYLARLMMVIPGATIHDLMDFMQEPESVRPHLSKLDDPISRRFFQTQFFSNAFDDTRHQILTRLFGVLSNRVLARMFTNKRNKVNLFEAMNTGSLILIHTDKDLLKQEGCEILGRFFIALICQAAQERASLLKDRLTPTFVYIDEAHEYFDESMENLVNQARKFQVGLLLAHQNLDQFDEKLRATVMASTSIKMVGGLSAKDAGAFAKEMGCAPEFLQAIRKHEQYTEFACLVRNHTPRPLRVSIPLLQMEGQPRIHPAMLEDLIRRNRARYCADGKENPPESDTSTDDDSPLGDPDLL
jgi:hypothetical protein